MAVVAVVAVVAEPPQPAAVMASPAHAMVAVQRTIAFMRSPARHEGRPPLSSTQGMAG